MKKLLVTAIILLPLFVRAQKIDQQKLITQLKTLAKSGQVKFSDQQGKIKLVSKGDTTYYSKLHLAYSVDTSNTITYGYYDVVFDTKYPDIMNIIDNIVNATDFGYGKMEPGGGREGLTVYTSKGKKVGNIYQYISMTVDMDRHRLSIHGAD